MNLARNVPLGFMAENPARNISGFLGRIAIHMISIGSFGTCLGLFGNRSHAGRAGFVHGSTFLILLFGVGVGGWITVCI